MTDTNSTPVEGANVPNQSGSKVDQVASLLVDDEPQEELEASEDEAEPEQEAPAPEDDDEDTEEVTWADTLGLDEAKLALDDDGNFKGVKVKINGTESEVDLNTLVTGYQTAKSTTQKSQALAEERKKFQAQAQEFQNAFQTKLQEADQLANVLKQKMVGDFDGINWHQLRTENPAEYAALQADYHARQRDIEQITATIRANRDQFAAQQQQEQEQQRAAYLQEQTAKTLELIPEWQDKEAAQKDFDKMRNLTSQYGFSDEEFAAISDPRILHLLKSVSGVTKAEQKITQAKGKTPKMLQATRSRTQKPKQRKLDKLIKRAQNARGASKRSAQADAVAELLMTGNK